MNGFGLYVHVPFCAALCPYCDFAVVVGKRALHERYCDALVEEARSRAPAPGAAGSVFVGGGTPTALDAPLLARTLERLLAILPVARGAEITVEANPESVNAAALRTLRAAGVSRLSIGAQSFRDDVLRALGRTHSAEDVRRSFGAARAAGFDNVSIDLIYGGPGETSRDWEATLREAIALGPEHVSCYALTIEPRTPFGRSVARGAMTEPDQDALAERYEAALDALGGYRHYELSNWARPGFECRHNVLTWSQGEYLGLGIGAHSHVEGVRSWNTRSLGRYLDAPARAREGEERVAGDARAEEWLSLRMRLVEGIDLSEARARLGRGLDFAPLLAAGLVSARGGRLRLTRRGMLLENEVTARLLETPAVPSAAGA